MSVRAYLPTTFAALADALSDERIPPGPAHAVTDALREGWPEGGEEEWEYAALDAAAADCAGLWAGLSAGPDQRRRLVVAVDVDRVGPGTGSVATAVSLPDPVPLHRVAAVHADLTAEDAGDGAELCWFATQEIADLLG